MTTGNTERILRFITPILDSPTENAMRLSLGNRFSSKHRGRFQHRFTHLPGILPDCSISHSLSHSRSSSRSRSTNRNTNRSTDLSTNRNIRANSSDLFIQLLRYKVDFKVVRYPMLIPMPG